MTRVTLKHIADELGVTPQLVSYAINGKGTVSAQKRQLILTTAAEMGYRANGSAKAMRSGRSAWVSLLLSSSYSPFNGALTQGIINELGRNELHLHVERIAEDAIADEFILPRAMREWMSDGLILSYEKREVPEVEELIQRHRIPAIWTNVRREADCVYPDDEGAFFTATQQLLELGHRRILYVTVGDPQHYSTQDRQLGYERAMKEAHLPTEVIPISGDLKKRYATLRSILERQEAQRPTAILSYGSLEAMELWSTARAIGLRVPEELSLVAPTYNQGFEVQEGKNLSWMLLPFREVGASAVRLLLQKIENPRCILPPQPIPFGPLQGDTHAAVNT
jgi:LacI family transcriptional regulator